MARTDGTHRCWPPAALLGHVVSTSGNARDSVDWSVFDQYAEQTVTCVCGHTYRSHAKFVADVSYVVARKPCAVCGGERMKAARSDPETMAL